MQTHNTGGVSSIPPCVTFKTPLVRKAMGNHLIISTSLEKLRAQSLVSATLEIEYATQFNCFEGWHDLVRLIGATYIAKNLSSSQN